jgi:hypothetical protein
MTPAPPVATLPRTAVFVTATVAAYAVSTEL